MAVLYSCLNDLKFGRINHDGDLGDIGVGEGHSHELGHSLLSIDQSIVKVEVKHLGSVLNLLLGNGDCGVVVVVLNKFLELGRPGNVASLSDIEERNVRSEDELLHS